MKIKSISVSHLFGKTAPTTYEFNDDLNIITGRNGSGKTTIMKLAWFILSGNILLALKEIDFKSCQIITSEYICVVIRTGPAHCKIELETKDGKFIFEDDSTDPDLEPFIESAEDKANPMLMGIGSSIFFPTFRRIEGGFSMVSSAPIRNRNTHRADTDIDEALSSLSRKLSNKEHQFIAAISTQDIVSLLLRRYASFSEEINNFQGDVSRSVIEKIKRYEYGKSKNQSQEADTLLTETRSEIEKIEEFRSKTMLPLDAVRSLVEKLFKHSGISFGKRLNFGDAAEAVNSDVLSAGEKQLLSFICYNAFHKNSIVFIDEPELSLHVDWQRQLYTILQSQDSGSQFIFATHSPFIYAKYPEKEVAFGVDRGE